MTVLTILACRSFDDVVCERMNAFECEYSITDNMNTKLQVMMLTGTDRLSFYISDSPGLCSHFAPNSSPVLSLSIYSCLSENEHHPIFSPHLRWSSDTDHTGNAYERPQRFGAAHKLRHQGGLRALEVRTKRPSRWALSPPYTYLRDCASKIACVAPRAVPCVH